MSVHRRKLRDRRTVWSVRWREGERNRSRNFDRKRDAEAFDAELRRRRRLGDLDLLDAGKEFLADFAREWWTVYAEPHLAAKTLRMYADLWDRHVLPRLGTLELRRITPEVVENFQGDLPEGRYWRSNHPQDAVASPGRLAASVIWRRIVANPRSRSRNRPNVELAWLIRCPTEVVEAMRAFLLRGGRIRDATFVSDLRRPMCAGPRR